MNYYLYKITYKPAGLVYFGYRSCESDPKDDSYMGSNAWLCGLMLKHGIEHFEKEILVIANSKKHAIEMESRLIKSNQHNLMCVNHVRTKPSTVSLILYRTSRKDTKQSHFPSKKPADLRTRVEKEKCRNVRTQCLKTLNHPGSTEYTELMANTLIGLLDLALLTNDYSRVFQHAYWRQLTKTGKYRIIKHKTRKTK